MKSELHVVGRTKCVGGDVAQDDRVAHALQSVEQYASGDAVLVTEQIAHIHRAQLFVFYEELEDVLVESIRLWSSDSHRLLHRATKKATGFDPSRLQRHFSSN